MRAAGMKNSIADVSREATVILQNPRRRAAWFESAKRGRRTLLLVLGLGLFVVPWLSERVSDGVFEPKRSRRLFARDRVQRDPSAETLDLLLQMGFWIAGLGWVARVAWRERPAPGGSPEAGLANDNRLASGAPPAAAAATGLPAVAADVPGQSGARPSSVGTVAQPDVQVTPPADATMLANDVRYRIDSELGRGGMGVVYRATDTVLGRTVALKSLPAELLSQGELVERFRREARTLASLTHPNIVGVHDLVRQDGQLFMAMELVQGRDLSDVLEERGPMDEAEVVRIALQVARALDYAHRQDIIHRDFKPDNVLMTHDGTAKVTDFGLAKSQSGPRMTQTGAVMGTPYYMSPEQSSGEAVDARTDLYALGATLYELLCGEPPFVGNTGQILVAHISKPPPLLSERAPNVSEGMVALVHALLEKKRDDRPQSMAEVVERLSALEVDTAASA